MAENSDFATSILTSTLPRDVANFIPHSLDLSQTLIEKNLVVWFSNYTKMLIRYNQDLNLLVANGKDFFANSGEEFGLIDKIWNCVASCVTSQISVNDSLIKTMRHDVLGQLSAAMRDDVRFSELLVNSKELTEISKSLDNDDPNGEYQWNVKAPAVLSNFENYKRHEKGLLSSSFLSYMNAVNAKTSEMLQKNENAVNYILKEFNVDNEMAAYVDYMTHAKVEPPAQAVGASSRSSTAAGTAAASSSPAKNRSSRASVSSGLSETKKKLKLRSKMGSILGRRKKDKQTKASTVDAIPEDQSVSSIPSRQNTYSTRASVPDNLSSHLQQQQQKPRVERGSFVAPVSANGGPGQPSGIRSQTFSETVPLQPAVPQKKEHESVEGPLSTIQENHEPEGPNLVKYASSDEDSDVPTDVHGNRLSMLQAHQLDVPPKMESESEPRSRNTSSGKYSFDYGDEENKDLSVGATPKTNAVPEFPAGNAPATSDDVTPGLRKNVAPSSATATSIANEVGPPHSPPTSYSHDSLILAKPQDSTVPVGEAGVAAGVAAVAGAAGAATAATAAPGSAALGTHQFQQPPPPPPSRKVHTTGDAKVNRRDLHSGTFHNLPPARELMIQPRFPHDEAGTRTSLVSQHTGNSFFRHDNQFKHFGSSQQLVSEGLHTSVAEIINATFKTGEVAKSQVLGEVAFNYNSVALPQQLQEISIPVSFNKFLLNEQFMRQVDERKYTLDLSRIASRTLGGLKYILNIDGSKVPVLVRQIWKFEPHQASLIIKLSHNPSFGQQVQLDGLVISASLDQNSESTSASSKPEGTYNKDKNRITWRYTKPLILGNGVTEEKLIARFMTNGQAAEAPTGVQLKFNVINSPTAYVPIEDSFGTSIPSYRSLTTGSYISHA